MLKYYASALVDFIKTDEVDPNYAFIF